MVETKIIGALKKQKLHLRECGNEYRRERPHLPEGYDGDEELPPIDDVRQPPHEERRRCPESEEGHSDVTPQVSVLLFLWYNTVVGDGGG